jgi:hypothetical protein
MSIKFETVEKDEFEANIATLYCDETGKKMLEIIIIESDQKNTIQAKWDDAKSQSSGLHEITGDIYCSPIETVTQKTAIIKAMTEKKNGIMNHRILVKKI